MIQSNDPSGQPTAKHEWQHGPLARQLADSKRGIGLPMPVAMLTLLLSAVAAVKAAVCLGLTICGLQRRRS